MLELRIYNHKNEQKISMKTHTTEILKTLHGKDYILTEEDKKEIADIVVDMVDVQISDAPEGAVTVGWVKNYAQPKGEYITQSQLGKAVEDALDQAKASGDFKGEDGKTPVAGIDYFKQSDIDEMIEEVLVQIGAQPVFGVVDDNKNIVFTVALEDGDYTLKFKNADDTTTSICTMTVVDGVVIFGESSDSESSAVNLIESAKSHEDLTTIFNGVGYKNGAYASSASPFYGTDTTTVCTGCIPATINSVFYIKGVTLNSNSHVRFAFGKNNTKGVISNHCVKVISELTSYITVEELAQQYYKVTFNSAYFASAYPELEYMYFSAVGTGENLIVATTPIQ